MPKILPFQEHLRPALPIVLGCKDYRDEKQLLQRVDRILCFSGIEEKFLQISLERWEKDAATSGVQTQTGSRAQQRHQGHSRRALRCTILKYLLRMSYRQLSKALAIAPLYRWFCRLEEFEQVRVPAKSTLRDYAHWLPADEMEQILASLTRAAGDEQEARLIGLENELEYGVLSVDTTCLKANIHFPTDWVLLRDAVRTITKCILTIRRHGLKRRIPEPESFLREANGLAMGMSAASRRKPGSRKERKAILRRLKGLTKVVEEHGRRYQALLDEHWQQSDLTRKEAEVILRRLGNVLDQLPAARHQAHERIIGERKVANEDKILSLYDSGIHVIVRGKAGAEVEFGNSLFVAETTQGYIIDHELKEGRSRGDAQWLLERYPVMKSKAGATLCGIVSDRGFDSKATRRMLDEDEIFDGLCPRDPKELTRRMSTEEVFATVMRGRGKTEARIGILKNVFLDGLPLAKGFGNRQLQVAWAVLSHNLWVVARMPWEEPQQSKIAEAA